MQHVFHTALHSQVPIKMDQGQDHIWFSTKWLSDATSAILRSSAAQRVSIGVCDSDFPLCETWAESNFRSSHSQPIDLNGAC